MSVISEPLPGGLDEKKVNAEVNTENDDSGLEDGHMQELEVDMDGILKDGGEEDIDGDHSPYAEGSFSLLDLSPPLQLT
jgi:hypothetical protein